MSVHSSSPCSAPPDTLSNTAVGSNPDVEQLDKIEVLLNWCREHVRPPPADLLYDAVGALACLRRAA